MGTVINWIKNVFIPHNNDMEMLSKLKILSTVSFLNMLNNFEMRAFARLFIERKYKKGEIVFKEGFPHSVLYMVGVGDIEVYLEKEGQEITISHYMDNSHFGEVGLFLDTNRIANARASKDSTIYAVSKTDFKKFVQTYPVTGVKVLYNLGESLALSLIRTNKKLKEHGFETD